MDTQLSQTLVQPQCLKLVLLLSRSIQKLEEMNVGIDHRGEDVMSHLGQQWNGLMGNNSVSSPQTTSSCNTPETGLLRDKPGGVTSSTPLRTGNHKLPSLGESPVPTSHR